MADKRTQAQLDFDLCKHGWAFCNADMLEGKLIRLRELAKALSGDVKRQEALAYIETRYAEMKEKGK